MRLIYVMNTPCGGMHFCCIFSSLCIDTLSIALKEYKLAMLEVLLELLDPGLEPHMITVRVHH